MYDESEENGCTENLEIPENLIIEKQIENNRVTTDKLPIYGSLISYRICFRMSVLLRRRRKLINGLERLHILLRKFAR